MIFLIISIFICGIDLLIKNKIARMEARDFPKFHLKNKVIITRAYNKGIAFNHFDENPKKVKIMTTLILAMIFIISLPYLFTKKSPIVAKLGFALLLGGAASNVADRYIRGYVVDYIQLQNKNLKKSKFIFNISDFMVLFGSVLILFNELFHK